MEDTSKCKKHGTKQIKCPEEGCDKPLICKFCLTDSKESITHFAEHYESLKKVMNAYNESDLSTKIKEDETYNDLNKIYTESVQNVSGAIDSIFSQIYDAKPMLMNSLVTLFADRYTELTEKFEKLVKDLTAKLNSGSKLGGEILHLKKDLDEMMDLMNNPDKINLEFTGVVDRLGDILKKHKLQDVIDGKINLRSLKFKVSEEPVEVFGHGKGKAESQQQQDAYPASTIVQYHTSDTHWNSGKTDNAEIFLHFEPCQITEIKMAIRCGQYITIFAFQENGAPIELLTRRPTGKSDNATYGQDRLIDFPINHDGIFSKIRIYLEQGGNVSLFWVSIFGKLLI